MEFPLQEREVLRADFYAAKRNQDDGRVHLWCEWVWEDHRSDSSLVDELQVVRGKLRVIGRGDSLVAELIYLRIAGSGFGWYSCCRMESSGDENFWGKRK